MNRKRIYEDFLDDWTPEQKSASRQVADKSVNDLNHSFMFQIFSKQLKDTMFQRKRLNPQVVISIANRVEYICELSTIFEEYRIGFLFKHSIGHKELSEFFDKATLEARLQTFPYQDNDFTYNIRIEYAIKPDATLQEYCKTYYALYTTIYKTLTEKFKYVILKDAVSLIIENLTYEDVDYGVQYHTLLKIYDKFIEVEQTAPEERMSMFDSNDEFMGSDIQMKNIGRKLYFNEQPLRLSEKSEKRLDRCRPGDFLFYSQSKGLNLDFDGKIIAQFVDKIRETYRFCSIKYMSRVTPYSGSTLPYMHLKFGNFKVLFEELADDDMLRNDGALMTAAFVLKLNDIGYVGPRKVSVVPDDASQYHSPLYMATLLYKTPGTKSGDWYVPSHSELDMIFRNKDVINSARSSERLEEIADFFYFTCNEDSDVDCEVYDMESGNTYIASKRLAKIKGQEETCALAFLQMTE